MRFFKKMIDKSIRIYSDGTPALDFIYIRIMLGVRFIFAKSTGVDKIRDENK